MTIQVRRTAGAGELPEVEGVTFRHTAETDRYAVGDDGSVWSRCTRSWRHQRVWRQLKTTRRKREGTCYFIVSICFPDQPGKRPYRYVHRLILEAFVGPCPVGMVACHNDGDAANNRLTNLRWDTHAENIEDERRHGTMRMGVRHPKAKYDPARVMLARSLWRSGWTAPMIANHLGLPLTATEHVVHGSSWRYLPGGRDRVTGQRVAWDGTDDDAGEPRYADEPGEPTAYELTGAV